MQAERHETNKRAAEEAATCAEERRQQADARDLDLFALHLERDSSGAVTLTRLPPDNPQQQRCHRATTENVKRGYFDGSPFIGISVLDVYKVENTPLLKDFQAAAAEATAVGLGKVKGLFCSVPRDCVERLVVHGLREGPAVELKDAPSLPGLPSVASLAGDRAAMAPPLPLPLPLSRYATLEADRPHLSTCKRFLALCRVIVTEGAYDPRVEEYRISTASHALPEFIIAYTNTPSSPSPSHAAGPPARPPTARRSDARAAAADALSSFWVSLEAVRRDESQALRGALAASTALYRAPRPTSFAEAEAAAEARPRSAVRASGAELSSGEPADWNVQREPQGRERVTSAGKERGSRNRRSQLGGVHAVRQRRRSPDEE